MIDLPRSVSIDELSAYLAPRRAVLTGRASAVADVAALAGLPVVADPADTPEDADLLVVVGGGMRIDAAKAWRGQNRPDCVLLAIATRYGSGAEANAIAVLDDQGAKTIHVGPEFRPDARTYLPATLDSLTDADVQWSAGDALTHAVEGLLSPIATDELRSDLAEVVKQMLALGPSRDPQWFELSAAASAGQSQSSVGLVHGLAHVLEAPARAALGGDAPMGHARLCSGFLAPVLRFNFTRSDKAALRLSNAGIDQDQLLAQADALSAPALDVPLDWAALIDTHWKSILRDVCTRTNVATVRPGTLPDLLAELPS